MPLLAYFGVVGSVLVGLLYVAEAQLGPPTSLSISTNFHGLPAPWKAKSSIAILTVRDGPAPDMSSTNVVQSAAKTPVAQSAVEAQARALASVKTAGAKKARKASRVTRQDKGRNLFAHSAVAPRHSYGAVVW
jgi:hypothetical protein